jgi:hypothetical protein
MVKSTQLLKLQARFGLLGDQGPPPWSTLLESIVDRGSAAIADYDSNKRMKQLLAPRGSASLFRPAFNEDLQAVSHDQKLPDKQQYPGKINIPSMFGSQAQGPVNNRDLRIIPYLLGQITHDRCLLRESAITSHNEMGG